MFPPSLQLKHKNKDILISKLNIPLITGHNAYTTKMEHKLQISMNQVNVSKLSNINMHMSTNINININIYNMNMNKIK